MHQYRRDLKPKARTLRSSMTDAEQRLWSLVRRKQVLGVQFYRQKPVGDYIVDFYAPAAKLVIEVDGSQHLEELHARRDRQRDLFLQAHGLRMLRFDNLQVLKETEAVMQVIHQAVEAALRSDKSPLGPPFFKGGMNGQRDPGGPDDPDIPRSEDDPDIFVSEDDPDISPFKDDADIPPFEKGGSGGI